MVNHSKVLYCWRLMFGDRPHIMPDWETDEALMKAFRAGDETAFENIYRRYFSRVLFFARRYVLEEDAYDITADVFLQVWKRRIDFEHLEKLAKFIFVSTRNGCINFVQRQHMRSDHAADLAALMKKEAVDAQYLEHLVRMELLNLLELQINQLPEKMRMVFRLSYEEGLKPSEIAERMHISVKTVKNQKLTAIKLLKSALADHPLEIVLIVLSIIQVD